MASKSINLAGDRCVEPLRRMVGGRFGWAHHRFPIKGGITVAEAARRDLAMSLSRPSVLARLFGAAK